MADDVALEAFKASILALKARRPEWFGGIGVQEAPKEVQAVKQPVLPPSAPILEPKRVEAQKRAYWDHDESGGTE